MSKTTLRWALAPPGHIRYEARPWLAAASPLMKQAELARRPPQAPLRLTKDGGALFPATPRPRMSATSAKTIIAIRAEWSRDVSASGSARPQRVRLTCWQIAGEAPRARPT